MNMHLHRERISPFDLPVDPSSVVPVSLSLPLFLSNDRIYFHSSALIKDRFQLIRAHPRD